jgi:hypothetical protein
LSEKREGLSRKRELYEQRKNGGKYLVQGAGTDEKDKKDV